MSISKFLFPGLHNQIATLTVAKDKAEKSSADYRDKYLDSSRALSKANLENSKLKSQLEDSNIANTNLQSELSKAKGIIEVKNDAIEELSSKSQLLQTKVDTLSAKVKSYEDEKAEQTKVKAAIPAPSSAKAKVETSAKVVVDKMPASARKGAVRKKTAAPVMSAIVKPRKTKS